MFVRRLPRLLASPAAPEVKIETKHEISKIGCYTHRHTFEETERAEKAK